MENETILNSESKIVKEQLDAILVKNIRKLDQINFLGQAIQLGMVTVAALHLFTERESEIEEDEHTKKSRYNRKSFLNDLTDIGFEIDDDLMEKIKIILEQNYVTTDAEGCYHAQNVAKEVVNNINMMFPGMPGMNLVAYVIQTMEEILSGRKDLNKGLDQFDKALMSRGKPLTFVHLKTVKKTEKEKALDRIKIAQEREASRKASDKLKIIYSEKIARLRESLLKTKEEPVVVTKRAMGADDIQIKEISPHKIKEAQERERMEKDRQERERLELDRQELERQRLEIERLDTEQKERERLEQERQDREQKERDKALEEKEKQRAEQEAQANLEQEISEQERLKKEQVEHELSIEEQIASFEMAQATTCPLCHQGKILQESTESNKIYFKCTSKSCKFISWDKPHPFSCPQCRNPYLLEFRKPDGTLGLKCPLATCAYTQNGIGIPGQPSIPTPASPASSVSDGQGQPKKKRLVRRRRH